jgi:hypothetical protein
MDGEGTPRIDEALRAHGLRWFDDRNPAHLLAALRHCEQTGQPPPWWLIQLLARLVPVPSPSDVRAWLRWWWVKYGTKHKLTSWTDGACYEWAAAQIGEQISGEAVHKSYLRVHTAAAIDGGASQAW